MIPFLDIFYFNFEVIQILFIVYKNFYLRNRMHVQRKGDGLGRVKHLII
jgi:hypothetical protein